MKKVHEQFLLLALAANVLTAAIAVFMLRPIGFDGAFAAYNILTTGAPDLGADPTRLLIYLVQLPLVLWVRAFEAPQFLDWPLRLFGFCYQFHPFASLAACWLLCRKHGPYLFLFPLMSFAVATQATLPFTNTVPLVLSCLWPAALLLLLGTGTRRDFLMTSAALLGMLFSHQAAIFGFLGLMVLAHLRLQAKPGSSRERRFLRLGQLVCALMLGILICTGFLLTRRGVGATFQRGLTAGWLPYTWILVFQGLLFAVVAGEGAFRPRDPAARRHFWFMAILALAALLAAVVPLDSDKDAHNSRVLVVPLAAALFLGLGRAKARLPASAWSNGALWKPTILIVGAMLWVSAARDLRLTREHEQARSQLMATARTKSAATPCPILSRMEVGALGAPHVPESTILFQRRLAPEWVAGAIGVNGASAREFCAGVAAGRLPMKIGHFDGTIQLGGKWIQAEGLRSRAIEKIPR